MTQRGARASSRKGKPPAVPEGPEPERAGVDPSLLHVLGRLAVVEARVRTAVARRRAGDPAPDDPFRGLYTSERELERLLEPPGAALFADDGAADLLARVEADANAAEQGGATLRLRRLERSFDLAAVDTDILLLALAPDVDSRFERLFSYLHDDVTRRRVSVGIALELAGAPALAPAARARLREGGPLVDGGLVVVEDPDRPFLTRALRVPDRVTMHLLGDDTPHALVQKLLARHVPCLAGDPVALASAFDRGASLCYIQERRGASGRALAAAAFEQLGVPVLLLDLEGLEEKDVAAAATAARQEARLRGAGLVAGPIEALAEHGPGAVRAFCDDRWPVVLVGSRSWDPRWSSLVPLMVEAPAPAVEQIARMWRALLGTDVEEGVDVVEAASTFNLSPEQVERAASSAWWQAAYAGTLVGHDELQAGARAQNAAGLERLAHRIVPGVSWDDIVLPPQPLLYLTELGGRARLRSRVLDEWGMRQGGRRGGGIAALFAGPSGTGKTMAAEVIAHDLGFELYTIDLATVVDKYIGETEKNLDRIFTEAERVNGVLFFDEADALFGKRSEVKDAHDRYANVETAFLLQRMETFDGIAILATNLRSNLDEAFARRLDAVIDFPMPNAEHRRMIWERSLRPGVPRGDDLDLEFLASRFELAGGNIRNIALTAAFFAAADDRPVSMADLIRGTQREFLKLGRLCLESDFEPYYSFLQ